MGLAGGDRAPGHGYTVTTDQNDFCIKMGRNGGESRYFNVLVIVNEGLQTQDRVHRSQFLKREESNRSADVVRLSLSLVRGQTDSLSFIALQTFPPSLLQWCSLRPAQTETNFMI